MYRFDEFEADETTGELWRRGQRIKLQDLPFRMLVTLLQRPGQVVTREDIRAALWGAETFVDAEAGLNTAAAKLREALGDSAEQPRFIETVPKRGYRFIATVHSLPGAVSEPDAPPGNSRRNRGWLVPAMAAVVVVVAGLYAWSRVHAAPISIAVVRFHNETGQPEYDRVANDLTDAVVVSLAADSRYAVIGNSPVLRTERIFEDVRKIGAAVGASFVVLGQLQSANGGLVVRAHFIRAQDEKHLWASPIDVREVENREQRVTSAVIDGVAKGLARR